MYRFKSEGAAAAATTPLKSAQSGRATHSDNNPDDRAAQVRGPAPRRAEMRASFAGRTFLVRYDLDDPHWRVRALAGLDPLSDAAFAIRAAPPTRAECVAFAVWAAREEARLDDAAWFDRSRP